MNQGGAFVNQRCRRLPDQCIRELKKLLERNQDYPITTLPTTLEKTYTIWVANRTLQILANTSSEQHDNKKPLIHLPTKEKVVDFVPSSASMPASNWKFDQSQTFIPPKNTKIRENNIQPPSRRPLEETESNGLRNPVVDSQLLTNTKFTRIQPKHNSDFKHPNGTMQLNKGKDLKNNMEFDLPPSFAPDPPGMKKIEMEKITSTTPSDQSQDKMNQQRGTKPLLKFVKEILQPPPRSIPYLTSTPLDKAKNSKVFSSSTLTDVIKTNRQNVEPLISKITNASDRVQKVDSWTTKKPFWSPVSVAQRQKQMPIYAPDGIDTLEDYSAQCCEWALMGLCDRNWQRIRQLCPKSCGHLICATIDDALLCNRAIDVDMLDCYKRKIRAYAASNRIPNVPEDTSFKEKYEKKSQNDKRKTGNYLKNEQPVYSRAYAIENELRSYHSLGDF